MLALLGSLVLGVPIGKYVGIFLRCEKSTVIQNTSAGLIKSNLVFLFIINKNVNFGCISIA